MKDAKPHIALCLNDPDVVRVLSSRLEADFKVSFAHSIDRLHSISLSSSLELALIATNMHLEGIEKTIEDYVLYDSINTVPLKLLKRIPALILIRPLFLRSYLQEVMSNP